MGRSGAFLDEVATAILESDETVAGKPLQRGLSHEAVSADYGLAHIRVVMWQSGTHRKG